MTTLYDHWKNYTRDYPSPDIFIEWGFYSLMSCALQRKVWTGPNHLPIYPNTFIFFVGKPATGKSIIMGAEEDILRYHILMPKRTDDQKKKLKVREDLYTSTADLEVMDGIRRMLNPPLLIPIGADSTTYESITKELAGATRTHKWSIESPETGEINTGTYFHCSMVFAMNEVSNLFRKKSEDIVRLLGNLYDCKKAFTYKTKHQGEDCIQNGCISMVGCTTADFLQACFNDGLLREGFASRSFFICADESRFRNYDAKELDASQKESLHIIQQRVLEMATKLYGNVTLTEDCHDLARKYYEIESVKNRINTDPRLDDYYGRTRYHMDKICMAIHFADNDSMTMEIESMEKALYALQQAEKTMHRALDFKGKNPHSSLYKKIVGILQHKGGGLTQGEIFLECNNDINNKELTQVLLDLKELGKIKPVTEGNKQKWKFSPGSVESKNDYDQQSKSGSQKIGELLEKVSNL